MTQSEVELLNTLTGRIRLDFRSNEPIYVQMVQQIEKLVKDGMLKPGDQLPTVRELAIDLRINFSTVARAYRILDEQKLISTQRGRGTYIWAEADLHAGTERQIAQDQLAPNDEAERGAQVGWLARRTIEEALLLGYSLEEIKQAFDREASRKTDIHLR